MDYQRINGYGQLFRFITPILITIAIFILSGLKDEVKEVKQSQKEMRLEQTAYASNHLEHHRAIETQLCERLARIETKLK